PAQLVDHRCEGLLGARRKGARRGALAARGLLPRSSAAATARREACPLAGRLGRRVGRRASGAAALLDAAARSGRTGGCCTSRSGHTDATVSLRRGFLLGGALSGGALGGHVRPSGGGSACVNGKPQAIPPRPHAPKPTFAFYLSPSP